VSFDSTTRGKKRPGGAADNWGGGRGLWGGNGKENKPETAKNHHLEKAESLSVGKQNLLKTGNEPAIKKRETNWVKKFFQKEWLGGAAQGISGKKKKNRGTLN